jgi:hypothetical protein
MKTCNRCGTSNQDTSRFCRECAESLEQRTQARAQHQSLPVRRVAFYVVAGLAALALLVAGISSLVVFTGGSAPRKDVLESAGDFLNGITGANGGSREGAAEQASKFEERKLPGKTVAGGEEVRTRDLVVTVSGSRPSDGAAIQRPVKGDRFVVCDVAVRNAGARPVLVSSMLQMSLQDRAGKVYGTGLFFPGPAFPEGEVKGGESASGKVAFEVPVRSVDLYFVFDPEILRDGEEVAVRLF